MLLRHNVITGVEEFRVPEKDEFTNPILDLALTVTVKGGLDENLLFYVCLRKWLVAMIAGWLDDDKVNQKILVFVGGASEIFGTNDTIF